MAETPAVCHQLHMPLQSGSDDVLKRMRRAYRRDRYLGILDRVRAAMPDAAITTDIIVGFPGETEADFQDTLDVVREARFASAFTFQYSKRPGTPAAEMAGQLPRDVVQERYLRLTALQDEISWSENRALIGRTVELLVAAGRAARTRSAAGCPDAPGTAGSSTSARRPVSAPATSSRRSSPTRSRTSWWPTARCCPTAGPGRGTPPRPAARRRPRASCSACPVGVPAAP